MQSKRPRILKGVTKRLFDNDTSTIPPPIRTVNLATVEPSRRRCRLYNRAYRLIPWLIARVNAREERYVCYPDRLVSLL
jgi:hypothetical protein